MKVPVTFGAVALVAIPAHQGDVRSGQTRSKHVLVVDDEEAIAELIARVLTQGGGNYVVDRATDGEAGWSALCARAYDLLITDNDMPRLTGVELVTRARRAGMTLPVVMASGSAVLEASHDSGWLEISAFLRKPFAIQELADLVSRRLSPVLAGNTGEESKGPRPSAALFVPLGGRWDHWGLNE